MRFHCVTALASGSAGGAADAPMTPTIPTRTPMATAMTETDRLPAILLPPLVPPSVDWWQDENKRLKTLIASPLVSSSSVRRATRAVRAVRGRAQRRAGDRFRAPPRRVFAP